MPDRPDSVAGLDRRPTAVYHRPAEDHPAGRRQEPQPSDIRQGSPALPWLAALAALSLVVNLLYSRYLFADSYYDLYAGRYILRHGIPHHNVVTVVSRGAPWVDQQWLAHVLYYGAWALGGYPALAVFSALLVTSGFAILGLLMLTRDVPPTRMFIWTAAAIVVYLGNIVIRAQSFAYPLFALTLWLIVADGRAPRPRARTWLVLPVLVVWANTHGSVLVGAAMVMLYAGWRAALAPRRAGYRAALGYLALGAAAAGSVLCTPYGTAVVYYYKAVNSATPALSRYVTEWERPSPLYLVSIGFFAVLAATVVGVVVAWRRGTRPDPLLAVIALAMLVLALAAIRNQTWFGFAGCLLAADTLARSNAGRAPVLSRAFSRATAAALGAAALAGVALIAAEPAGKFQSLVPVRAIDAAAALAARDPAARVLADEWSSPPLLWLHPALFGRVAFDARLEQYSVAQLSTYAGFLSARSRTWQRLMRGYDIVVVSRQHHGSLATALARLAAWRTVYSGRDGLVLTRRAAPGPRLTEAERTTAGGAYGAAAVVPRPLAAAPAAVRSLATSNASAWRASHSRPQ